ncbi:hypothetical protein BBO99_00009170, partial [Phytophthora kernoviae]
MARLESKPLLPLGNNDTHHGESFAQRLLSIPREVIPLSLLAFGGPPAHLALAHDRFVYKHKWLTDERFLEVLSISSAIPGPSSTQDNGEHTLLSLFYTFYWIGSIIFGGGQVMLPMLLDDVVMAGWVTKEQFLIGLALVQSLPGPLFNIAAYLGALLYGVSGSIVTTMGLFGPGIILFFGLLPLWERVRNNKSLKIFLSGVNASATGLIMASFMLLWEKAVHSNANAAVGLATALMVGVFRMPMSVAIILGSILGFLLSSEVFDLGQKEFCLLSCVHAWWKPTPDTSYQIQLSGTLDLSYDVNAYDIDIFDTPNTTIAELQQRGIKVICYFSAGTYEDWRTDKDRYASDIIGTPLDEWEGESWVDIRSSALREIISDRMKLAQAKGCDGVDPDNVDGAFNDNGFDLTADDQLDFNIFLASTAHDLDLTVGLKNDLDQIKDLVSHFDFAVNEQCVQYDECDVVVPFIDQDKPVFGIEYSGDKTSGCATANSLNFDTLFKTLSLQGERYSCREMAGDS